MQLAFVIL